MRILGRHEPTERGRMLLARRATAELGLLGGLGKAYAVVEMAPALPDQRSAVDLEFLHPRGGGRSIAARGPMTV